MFKYLPVLTHSDVGQLVCTAVWIDSVQCWTIQVNTPQDKCGTYIPLISKEIKQVNVIKNALSRIQCILITCSVAHQLLIYCSIRNIAHKSTDTVAPHYFKLAYFLFPAVLNSKPFLLHLFFICLLPSILHSC